MDEKSPLIYLELPKDVCCSLAIITRNGQKQIIEALAQLREFMEKPHTRPEHLKEDSAISEHINLHELMLDHTEVILQDIEQSIVEQEAEEKAEQLNSNIIKPFWEKL